MPIQFTALNKSNLSLPLVWAGASFKTARLLERYEVAISQLVQTPRGSLLYDPFYGTVLEVLRNQGLSDTDLEVLESDIAMAFSMYLPDLRLLQITAERDPNDGEITTIHVHWDVRGAKPTSPGNLHGPKQTPVVR